MHEKGGERWHGDDARLGDWCCPDDFGSSPCRATYATSVRSHSMLLEESASICGGCELLQGLVRRRHCDGRENEATVVTVVSEPSACDDEENETATQSGREHILPWGERHSRALAVPWVHYHGVCLHDRALQALHRAP